MLVPRAKPARPTPGHIHSCDHGVLATNMTDQIDGPVDQHPPEVRILTLIEQIDARLDANLRTVIDQIAELIICQALEDAQ